MSIFVKLYHLHSDLFAPVIFVYLSVIVKTI